MTFLFSLPFTTFANCFAGLSNAELIIKPIC
jgi:hypothetical protein